MALIISNGRRHEDPTAECTVEFLGPVHLVTLSARLLSVPRPSHDWDVRSAVRIKRATTLGPGWVPGAPQPSPACDGAQFRSLHRAVPSGPGSRSRCCGSRRGTAFVLAHATRVAAAGPGYRARIGLPWTGTALVVVRVTGEVSCGPGCRALHGRPLRGTAHGTARVILEESRGPGCPGSSTACDSARVARVTREAPHRPAYHAHRSHPGVVRHAAWLAAVRDANVPDVERRVAWLASPGIVLLARLTGALTPSLCGTAHGEAYLNRRRHEGEVAVHVTVAHDLVRCAAWAA